MNYFHPEVQELLPSRGSGKLVIKLISFSHGNTLPLPNSKLRGQDEIDRTCNKSYTEYLAIYAGSGFQ